MIYTHNNISEFMNWIDAHPHNTEAFGDKKESEATDDPKWYGTDTYEEAEELLLYGWKPAIQKLKSSFNIPRATTSRNVPSYSVVGHTASVPRYLQGIPTNMVTSRPQTQLNKVITLNKDVTFPGSARPEQMMEYGLRTLTLLNDLEAKGYRVRLNIICGSSNGKFEESDVNIIHKITVKHPDQRLNLNRISFPVAHPSFFRRIFFKALERSPEATSTFRYGYGRPYSRFHENMPLGDEIYIPAEIPEGYTINL